MPGGMPHQRVHRRRMKGPAALEGASEGLERAAQRTRFGTSDFRFVLHHLYCIHARQAVNTELECCVY